ncbi:MAG: hypothetical protein KAX20_00330 [Candidatus Omnitrophica bacterium]|nr:hypothetical protein [Candidatus Omnitrophota bacterium]
MGKRIAICLSLMVVLYFLVCLAAAQADVLRVFPEESTVLDKNTLEKWTLEEFERDNVKLLVGHEIEVNLILHREVSDIPDSYYLELRTDLDNPDWNYEGNHYKGSPVTVWNSSFEHLKSVIGIGLTAKVPDTLTISDIKEPYFEECPLTGINEKKHHFELTIYNRGTFVDTAKRTEFLATSSKLMDMTKEIKEGLEGALNAGIDYPESELIYNLLEGGHPGWAYSLYKSLNVPSNQQLLGMKKAIEENIEEAHKKGLNYPSLETRIENLFKNGNPEEAKDLSAEYAKVVPTDHPPLGIYAILFIVGLAIGAVSSIFIFKIGEKERYKRLQKLEELPERISQTAEKIRNLETKEADTSKKREFKNVREDLEEVESEIKKGVR